MKNKKHYSPREQALYFDRKIVEETGSYENDRYWDYTRNDFIKFMLKFIQPYARVLDIGCGNGYYPFHVAKNVHVKEIVAIDVSPKMIEYAKTHFSSTKIHYYATDFMDFSCEQASFDIIYSCEVIEHVNQYEAVVEKISHAIKSGGVFFLSTPNALRLENRIRQLLFHQPVMMDDSHVKEFSLSELRVLCTQYGFKPLIEQGRGLYANWLFTPLYHFHRSKLIRKILDTNLIKGYSRWNYWLGSLVKNAALKIQACYVKK